MRPLFHPSVEAITVEGVLHALSDPVRASIYARIAQAERPQSCSNFLGAGDSEIPKSTLSQHFKVLREAGLIRGERRGVEMLNTTRCGELEGRFPGLLPSILKAHGIQQAEGARRGKGRRRGSRKAS